MLMYSGHLELPVTPAVDGDEEGNLKTTYELINIADIRRVRPIPLKNMYGKDYPEACWLYTSDTWFFVDMPFSVVCNMVNNKVKEMLGGKD